AAGSFYGIAERRRAGVSVCGRRTRGAGTCIRSPRVLRGPRIGDRGDIAFRLARWRSGRGLRAGRPRGAGGPLGVRRFGEQVEIDRNDRLGIAIVVVGNLTEEREAQPVAKARRDERQMQNESYRERDRERTARDSARLWPARLALRRVDLPTRSG